MVRADASPASLSSTFTLTTWAGAQMEKNFMGEITRWNAADIAALNPICPARPCDHVVVRADGSGTTFCGLSWAR